MADTTTTKLNLYNDVTVNGTKFRRGANVEVPKDMADQIAELDYDAQKKRMELIRQPEQYMAPVGINPLTGRAFSNNE